MGDVVKNLINESIETAVAKIKKDLYGGVETNDFSALMKNTTQNADEKAYRVCRYIGAKGSSLEDGENLTLSEQKKEYDNIVKVAKDNELKPVQDKHNKLKKDVQTRINALKIYEDLKNEKSQPSTTTYYIEKADDITTRINDINNVDDTENRKAYYINDYIDVVKYWQNSIFFIYWILVVIYFAFLIREKKYKSKLHVGLFVGVVVYPFLIDRLINKILDAIAYVLHFTPASIYFGLYKKAANIEVQKDDKVYVHYTQLSDIPTTF